MPTTPITPASARDALHSALQATFGKGDALRAQALTDTFLTNLAAHGYVIALADGQQRQIDDLSSLCSDAITWAPEPDGERLEQRRHHALNLPGAETVEALAALALDAIALVPDPEAKAVLGERFLGCDNRAYGLDTNIVPIA